VAVLNRSTVGMKTPLNETSRTSGGSEASETNGISSQPMVEVKTVLKDLEETPNEFGDSEAPEGQTIGICGAASNPLKSDAKEGTAKDDILKDVAHQQREHQGGKIR
jgi:hypothetical protein